MGWQRFNRTTRVFEVSDDNGASWQVLKIAAEGVDVSLPSNLAYTNVENIFTLNQRIKKYAPQLILMDDGSSVVGKRTFDVVSYSDNFRVRALSDDANTLTRELLVIEHDSGTASLSGILNSGSIRSTGDVLCQYPVYPGRMDTGWTQQAAWYLASHGSYGLYSNTGFYTEGGIYSANYFYDATSKPFGLPICYPQTVDPNSYLSTPHLPRSNHSMEWAIVGRMLYMCLYFVGQVNAGAPAVAEYSCALPGGKVVKNTGGTASQVYDGVGWGAGSVLWNGGENFVHICASNRRVYSSGELQYHYSSMWIPIQ